MIYYPNIYSLNWTAFGKRYQQYQCVILFLSFIRYKTEIGYRACSELHMKRLIYYLSFIVRCCSSNIKEGQYNTSCHRWDIKDRQSSANVHVKRLRGPGNNWSMLILSTIYINLLMIVNTNIWIIYNIIKLIFLLYI